MVEAYLTFTSEEQKRVGVTVNQAAPMLEHIPAPLPKHMRLRALSVDSIGERIALTRDIALHS